MPIGTYTITLNSLGYLDRDGEQLSQTTANVVAKKVVFSTMSYDVADEAMVSVLTHTPGKTWANAGATQQPPSRTRNVTTMNGAKVGFAKTYTPGSPQTSVTANQLFPFAENSYTFFTGACRYQSPDKVTNMSNSTPLYPNYFSSTGGVNPDAAELLDPSVNPQPAFVRQPPFNIRVGSTRSGATFSDANMRVYATLQKPAGYSSDTCAEAKYQLYTIPWDAAKFGTRTASNGGGNDHWVSSQQTAHDPGMPFGTYQLCLRDNNLNRGVVLSALYDNTNPNGGPLLDLNGGSYTWTSGLQC